VLPPPPPSNTATSPLAGVPGFQLVIVAQRASVLPVQAESAAITATPESVMTNPATRQNP
jgi:hypothetical protein